MTISNEKIIQSVDLYLSLSGETRQEFISMLADMSQQASSERIELLLKSTLPELDS
ncbi:hypothetical protein [Idiomarina aminovorans]|uniref:hypothetical protein n=1 Tax=Idiomarina aminovorans TaxID=2914829 RepID=UPI002002F5C4|nr:hypothetical protein [Idiomarina sp. ATCH4]MCK7458589.1 hypothetical protein [Idiomarina sp. ATCH4]